MCGYDKYISIKDNSWASKVKFIRIKYLLTYGCVVIGESGTICITI